MEKDIVKIDLQVSKCDFGLSDNLVGVIESSNKLVELNNSVMDENKQLKARLKIVEDEVQDLKNVNNMLYDKIKHLEEEKQKFIQVNNFKNLLSLSEDLGKRFLEKIEWDTIDDNELAELLRNSYKFESYSNVIHILMNVLIGKSKELNHNDSKSLDLLREISKLINMQIEKEISCKEMLYLLDVLYQKIDEDLLFDFTYENVTYINNLIFDCDISFLSLNIKLARILFALEDYDSADQMLMILDETPSNILILDYEMTIDIILMLICLTPYTGLDDFKGINLDVLDRKYIEGRVILDYFESIKTGKATKDQIEILKNNPEIVNADHSEVTSSIREFSYNNIATKLFEFNESEVTNQPPSEKKYYVSNADGSISRDNIIYLINLNKNICPYDHNKLAIKNIVRKIFRTKEDIEKGINYQYKLIDILYCNKCNRYFINKSLLNKIEGKISVGRLDLNKQSNKFKDKSFSKVENKLSNKSNSNNKSCSNCLLERAQECFGKREICEFYKPCPSYKIDSTWPTEMSFNENRFDK
ncbi:hypothetical protein DES36_1167 [Alkalibaculum bacchi]|jgi:hypothetical protein|uniref:Uncharacterized protein n=1 Tax=Alkalibaculum bacchi TaxID=645887 RepID=A0A366I0N7_9FIRM|nr:hypothetical protein [Alkalibaculum bacchi]RBP60351.1 hypothetical protein DES36_1167 [Alkalibaculum bacchi]